MNKSTERPRVLCVDDEESILNALKRAFRTEPFDIVCTSSPNKALRLLEKESFAVVVSDYRMPEMSGAELLFFVNELHPDTKRILLTGQADTEAVVAPVNQGGIHKYFVKPWDNLSLSSAIRECINLRNLEQDNKKLTAQLQTANLALQSLNEDLTSRLVHSAHQRDERDHYDADTMLSNETLLLKTVDSHIDSVNRSGSAYSKKLIMIAVGLIDYPELEGCLDNTTLTQTIHDLADDLEKTVRDIDLLARVRPDTFVVACWFEADNCEIQEIANRIVLASTRVHNRSAKPTYVSTCAGISFFSRTQHAITSSKLQLIGDLHRAVENNELSLLFQPRVQASNGELVAAEALLRWKCADRGMVSPAEFVPLLEQTGLNETVSEWTLNQVFMLGKKLREQMTPILITVNISPQQFLTGDLHQQISRIASTTGYPPSDFLEIEVTESTLIRNLLDTQQSLEKLQALGIKLAIDDFGTGYSSLNYLSELPADYIKIDQSFVHKMDEGARNLAVLKAIVSVARALDMNIIAEGVETAEQARQLEQLGCDELQGYLYSPPCLRRGITKYGYSRTGA